ncbi:MAG: type II toxin-antitoxin system HicB family antitoxin [Verrucomicrobia bacterium]|nr:type II toxin-antitoxin system HicB family antitoxin [Verrucomicrobiota bacterium]MCG2679930.1 type II toxin-antitoxin system HicB family antitoxin [Kiritimatiellia bacterium]MBU4247274.1 type II toxin-antitoxin system HicB family antitoxin [Verrucomicrobiota bacterium]MBU4290555.1 type II toxin-antitoxin system HicB family antitoxin [Verrucomicrobiota bacterium]MBU4428515.1 type II toxin-antitoxin system HicB family antitoxin [Verrucomicrobiota bacterium]
MKTIQVRLPERVHERAKKLAQEEQISLNYYIVTSVANEVTRQETRDFFRGAAAAFSPARFAEALSAIPDAPVPRSDRIK